MELTGSLPENRKKPAMGTVLLALVPIVWLAAGAVFLSGCSTLNGYQTRGAVKLAGLGAPVTVIRDEKGMAYIHAADMADAGFAQGFVTAQDRLFQMELMRLFSQGRLSELIGEKTRPTDLRMRTLGFYRLAKTHAALLDAPTRNVFERYVAGVNAYVLSRPQTHPLEFKLTGIRPTPWTVADALAIYYYMGWSSSANMKTEIVAQLLADKLGTERARELLPLNINPDDPREPDLARSPSDEPGRLGLAGDSELLAYLDSGGIAMGSNNWVVSGARTAGGKPVLANDPHLDARILPGPWYPFGVITPSVRVVGVTIPGLPGMPVFRNQHVAAGITNGYGDAQDLYIETLDPDDPERYLEGDRSIPFTVVHETLTIRDPKAAGGKRQERIGIRLTRRGPVISEVLPKPLGRRVLSLRWAPAEAMGPRLGLDRLFLARSAAELREMLADVGVIGLNFVFADAEGNIGWHVTGKLPVRTRGDGTFPMAVSDGSDNWTGWIPHDRMPHDQNPVKGWIGTCNHKTVAADYPYYYSSHQAPSFRYRRLSELLARPGLTAPADHWRYQRDTLNPMAREIAPVMASALESREETREMGRLLAQWDHHDAADRPEPAIFQAVYRHFALSVFEDDLGGRLTRAMLDNGYFWQERLARMVRDGASPWFDDVSTPEIRETRDMLFVRAALQAAGELGDRLGPDPKRWTWGKIHRITFVSPIRREGFGKTLLGGGTHPVGGSAETLRRNMYDFNAPYDVTVSDSLRMVADLADPDKVWAVLPGGLSGRVFHPHATDQIRPFLAGEPRYWWFSDREIRAHAEATLVLSP